MPIDITAKNGQIEELDHTADLSIRVRGRDLRTLFIHAARGMFGLMADLAALEDVEPRLQHEITLQEYDRETLLVAWLSELLWLNEEHKAIFTRYAIKTLTSTQLQATVWGTSAPEQWKSIKAVTFHDLDIIETDDGYQVTLVFDV
jgi:SHS2 domain-containing protein